MPSHTIEEVARNILQQRGEQPTNVNLSAIMDALLVNPDLFDNAQGSLRQQQRPGEADRTESTNPIAFRDPFDQALEQAVNGDVVPTTPVASASQEPAAQPAPPLPPFGIEQALTETPVTSQALTPPPTRKPEPPPSGLNPTGSGEVSGGISTSGEFGSPNAPGDDSSGILDLILAAIGGGGAALGGRALLNRSGGATRGGGRTGPTAPTPAPAPPPAAVPVARPAVGPIDEDTTPAQRTARSEPKSKTTPKPKRGQRATATKSIAESVGDTVDAEDAKITRTRSRATGPRNVTHGGRAAVNVEVDGVRYIVDDQGLVATEAGPENVFDVRDKTILQRIKQVLTKSGSKFAELIKVL